MKHFVLVDQMNKELNYNAKTILFDWAIKNLYLTLAEPNLSISQMIEYLNTKYVVRMEQWNDEFKHWRVGLDWLDEDKYVYIVEKPELCDALWEAVKYVIKRKGVNL